MKLTFIILGLLAAHIFLTPSAQAQTPDFIFSSFQCDPSSCEETGPLATTSSAFVNVDATCTGGVIPGLNKRVLATVADCNLPYSRLRSSKISGRSYLMIAAIHTSSTQ
jgi:hypothetical protein